MIQEVVGNLLDADAEALVNTVNTVGVMGKGIALQFRQASSSEYFNDYKRACESKELQIGKVHLFHNSSVHNPHFIINFPTKKHWKGKSKIEDIESGLKSLIDVVKKYNISSIAMPALGCGNGGLNWKDVKPLIEKAFAQAPEVTVLLYVPTGSPKADEIKIATKRPGMTPARAALISTFKQYLLPGYRLSMLEVQKLAYFLQAAGQDLRLEFVKQQYGPYAEKINHLLQRIDGHFIKGYGDRTQKAIEPTMSLVPDALFEAEAYLEKESSETNLYLQRVCSLIEGFEYPHGLELLSTVHWVIKDNEVVKSDLSKVVNLVHSWSQRKREKFSPKEIEVALIRLREQDWL